MRSLLVAVAVFLMSVTAAADPMGPVEVVPAPEGQGDIFIPGARLVVDLEQDYVEEEFLVSGEATIFTYNDPPVRGEIIPLEEDVPYTTRIIVRRPAHAGQFKGTVVIEWWNSTAGFDTAPVWDASAEFFARRGWVYIGLTNSTTSLDFLAGGCSLFGLLPPTCDMRYAELFMPENGQAFEMASQLVTALKSDGPDNPLPADFRVKRVFHSGQSQQGGSMVTYASAFHFPLNDGYFIQAASSARAINFGPPCDAEGAPPYPDCTPRLEGEQRLVRRDLLVPVYRAMTETDMGGVIAFDTRQEDTEEFRYYEMAGTAHVQVHKDVEVLPAGIFGPDPLFLEDACEFPLNTLADGPVFGSYLYNAMWRNMERQVTRNQSPPHGELIEVADGEIVRDEFGNARGGIRLPSMEVPIATYGGSNNGSPELPPFLAPLLNLFCRLSGTTDAFEDELLDELYPNHGTYVWKTVRSSNRLIWQRFLLAPDAVKIKLDAALSDVGCGKGFEIAFLVLPIIWIHRRRLRKPKR